MTAEVGGRGSSWVRSKLVKGEMGEGGDIQCQEGRAQEGKGQTEHAGARATWNACGARGTDTDRGVLVRM